jgi:hypothetical protein
MAIACFRVLACRNNLVNELSYRRLLCNSENMSSEDKRIKKKINTHL